MYDIQKLPNKSNCKGNLHIITNINFLVCLVICISGVFKSLSNVVSNILIYRNSISVKYISSVIPSTIIVDFSL